MTEEQLAYLYPEMYDEGDPHELSIVYNLPAEQ